MSELAALARPLGLAQATAFQCLNVKAWIFVIAAVSAFRPTWLPVVAGSAVVIVVMMAVVLVSAALWAAGGGAANRLFSSERAHRAVSVAMAVVLAVSVGQLWI